MLKSLYLSAVMALHKELPHRQAIGEYYCSVESSDKHPSGNNSRVDSLQYSEANDVYYFLNTRYSCCLMGIFSAIPKFKGQKTRNRKMMRPFAALIIVLLSLPVNAQSDVDWGVSAGATNYFGDINPDGVFRTPGVGIGLFSRINMHPRHSLKGSLMAGTIAGDDMIAGNDFQSGRGASFSGYVGELAAQFEFNFLPYSTRGRRWNYSPYLAAGAGIAFISTDVFTYTPVIPFAFGVKVNFYKNLGLEVEYGFRKTFYDNFDGLIDPVHPDDHPWTHNNDWYTFTGVSFTWKMFNRLAGCPAFEEEMNYKRRR